MKGFDKSNAGVAIVLAVAMVAACAAIPRGTRKEIRAEATEMRITFKGLETVQTKNYTDNETIEQMLGWISGVSRMPCKCIPKGTIEFLKGDDVLTSVDFKLHNGAAVIHTNGQSEYGRIKKDGLAFLAGIRSQLDHQCSKTVGRYREKNPVPFAEPHITVATGDCGTVEFPTTQQPFRGAPFYLLPTEEVQAVAASATAYVRVDTETAFHEYDVITQGFEKMHGEIGCDVTTALEPDVVYFYMEVYNAEGALVCTQGSAREPYPINFDADATPVRSLDGYPENYFCWEC